MYFTLISYYMLPFRQPASSSISSSILLFMRSRKPLAWQTSEEQKPNTNVVKVPPFMPGPAKPPQRPTKPGEDKTKPTIDKRPSTRRDIRQ